MLSILKEETRNWKIVAMLTNMFIISLILTNTHLLYFFTLTRLYIMLFRQPHRSSKPVSACKDTMLLPNIQTFTLPRCLISFTESFDSPWQIYGCHVKCIVTRDKCISIYLVNKSPIATIYNHCPCVRRTFHNWFCFYTIAFG